jgi:hypothetical protein
VSGGGIDQAAALGRSLGPLGCERLGGFAVGRDRHCQNAVAVAGKAVAGHRIVRKGDGKQEKIRTKRQEARNDRSLRVRHVGRDIVLADEVEGRWRVVGRDVGAGRVVVGVEDEVRWERRRSLALLHQELFGADGTGGEEQRRGGDGEDGAKQTKHMKRSLFASAPRKTVGHAGRSAPPAAVAGVGARARPWPVRSRASWLISRSSAMVVSRSRCWASSRLRRSSTLSASRATWAVC